MITKVNSVLNWLDATGLPWRETRGKLASKFGVSADNPYQWDLVSLDVSPPPLVGMLWPFTFQVFPEYSPTLPPVRLSTHVSVGDDPEANIQCAATQFAPHLGHKAVRTINNIREVEWQCGAASISLRVWPPKMQRELGLGNIPAHQRDARLATACSVEVWTGWRPPLSTQDQVWLDNFQPIQTYPSRLKEAPRPAPPTHFQNEGMLEFMRERPDAMTPFFGAFGLSGDREAIICCDNLLCIIPVAQVSAFEVFRTLRARGPGGSTLRALCYTGDSSCPTKGVPIAYRSNPDDLNDVAAQLAVAVGKPLKLHDYGYDD